MTALAPVVPHSRGGIGRSSPAGLRNACSVSSLRPPRPLRSHFLPFSLRIVRGGVAFTLVELMIAVVLASILMGIIAMVFQQAGTVVTMSEQKAELMAEARGIMSMIRRDLKSLRSVPNTHFLFASLNRDAPASESDGIDDDSDGRIDEEVLDGLDNDGDGEGQSPVDDQGRKKMDWKDNDGDGLVDEGIDEDCRYARDGMAFVVTNERGESQEVGYVLARDPSDNRLKLWRYVDTTPDGHIPSNSSPAATDGMFAFPAVPDANGNLPAGAIPEAGSEWQILSESVVSLGLTYVSQYCDQFLEFYSGWDPSGDANGDGAPGIQGVDDDGDGTIDEGDAGDDDEDGSLAGAGQGAPSAVRVELVLRDRAEAEPTSLSELISVQGGPGGQDGSASPTIGQVTSVAWQRVQDFPVIGYQYDPVIYSDHIYVVGGYNGVRFDTTYYARIGKGGCLGPWRQASSLPVADQGPGVTTHGDYIYVACTDSSNVFRSRVNADGTLAGWQSQPIAAPYRGGRLMLEAYEGFLYILGGAHYGNFQDVWVTRINTDGTLAGWSQTTLKPINVLHQSVHFLNGRVYMAGGHSGPIVDRAFSAPVNSDGSLGAWREEARLPHPVWYHNSVLVGEQIILLGGRNGYSGGPSTRIYRGIISSSDGRISSWSPIGDMPDEWVLAPGAAYSSRWGMVLLVGGGSQGSVTAKVRRGILQ